MSERSQVGFALLEAIVAITLLSVAMVPIFSLMTTSISSAYRVAEVNRKAEAELSALEVMRTINPMEQANGSIDLGLYAVSWNAVAAADPVDGRGYPQGNSLYRMGLYRTEVWAKDDKGGVLAHFSVRQVGYLKVRDIQIPFTAPRS